MIRARKLDETRSADSLGEKASALDREGSIVGPVQDQGRDTDRLHAGRTSIFPFIRVSARAAPGLALMRR
jgi:hypothetical protein